MTDVTVVADRGTISTGDGCRLAYRIDGPDGAPLLMLSNSLGTSWAMWDAQIPALTERFRVLRYDTRGHGASAVPAGAYSIDRLGRDVVELLDALQIEVVDFCGLSLGGMVGQWLGIHAPARLRRLILANTSSYMGPPANWDTRITLARTEGMEPLVDASLSRWFTPDFMRTGFAEIDAVREGLLATDPVGYAGCCAAIRDMDMRRTAALVTPKTLVIGGALDPATPPSHSKALANSIRGAGLEMLHAAHLSNVECPDGFAALMLGFLETCATPSFQRSGQ